MVTVSDLEAGLPDIYMGLLSSYNLQFQGIK